MSGASRSSSAQQLRIGVSYPGDLGAATTWSGIPRGLIDALRSHGADPVAIPAQPPRALDLSLTAVLALARAHRTPAATLRQRLRVSRTIAMYTGRQMPWVRSAFAKRAIRRGEPLDALIQIGTGYWLPPHIPTATFEDMTVPQAASLGYPEWLHLSVTELQSRRNGQARAYAHAQACCFASTWAAESAVHEYGLAPTKVHVVGMGRNHTPRAVERNWETPRFLFVGGDWERKNGPAVLRAFAEVRIRHPQARLDVVGNHPHLQSDGVVGHGWLSPDDAGERERVEQLFEQATCFVMPSLYEPFGIVYLEAAAGGLPSIGTIRGGAPEAIGDGGRAIDPTDHEALVEAMLQLSIAGEAERAGNRARQHAAEFTWGKVTTRILEALNLSVDAPVARQHN
jgi:glycosyltransferase involved in cell wall biosynthesis